MDKTLHTPWELLTASPVMDEIRGDWLNLLNDDTKRESAYQSFIQEHAGMFFPNEPCRELIVLSGIKLGSDHEVDLVLAYNDRSYGFVFELIEIEVPHETIYRDNGDPKARLIHAIQQTSNWKDWLEENHDQLKRLFPSKRLRVTGNTHFKYTVIMGRRGNKHINKRNTLAEKNNVTIRSYDWFTDNLITKRFRSFNAITSDILQPSYEDDNKFSDPFFKAFTDAEWRKIVDDPNLQLSHMVGHNLDILFKYRTYNNWRKKAFMEYLASLPGGPHVPSDIEYKIMSYR